MSFIDSAFAKAFGFDDFFAEQLKASASGDGQIAKIIQEEKGLYRIQCSLKDLRWAEISGKMFHNASEVQSFPTVGDWVLYKPLENSERAVISRILTRKSALHRKAAGEGVREQMLGANIDTAFVVTSLNSDLNLRRLERYFVLCKESQVSTVLVLTKRDLCSEEEFELAKKSIQSEYPSISIVGVSVRSGDGITELESFMNAGQTIALLGSSGVGKSSLTNYFLQDEVIKTQPIREEDGKGRHTTTGRHLFLLPQGALILDTPGMRELQLGQHSEGVLEVFDDIIEHGTKCKYSNCSHHTEPNCAIQAAIESGEISSSRWKSYLKLQRELEFQAQKHDKAARSNQKEKWKKIHKEQRANYKQRN